MLSCGKIYILYSNIHLSIYIYPVFKIRLHPPCILRLLTLRSKVFPALCLLDWPRAWGRMGAWGGDDFRFYRFTSSNTYLILSFFNILSFPVSLNKTKERADIVLTIFIDLLPYKRNSIHRARETPADDVDET